ncbi:MAG TPA: sodium/solute symporter [Terracidiphilus sp.]|nr:sodium/solute symporter [Terracidiphilus sp.]
MRDVRNLLFHDRNRTLRLSSPSVPPASANALTFLVIALYLAAAIVVGYLVRRHAGTSREYLHSRGALPTAVSALAFLAANCGALEIVGIAATSAKYGVLALHFYWIGAIPAMVFLALFMMPVYLRSGAMTVPDFVRLRYNNATHILCAFCLAVMMVLIAGISLFAISTVLRVFFGWNFSVVAVVAASVVLCYALAGGLRATIYNEIFQLALTVAGLLPLAYAVYRSFHGVHGILSRLPPAAAHVWSMMPVVSPRTATLDDFGVVLGLGLVLSFGYWCTDFVLIQRALTAKTFPGAIHTPLIAAVFKLLFPWLMIFPGMAAALFLKAHAHPDFDRALPLLIRLYYGPALLGLGISAILASLMSGLAGNISAFTALWTHDLYEIHLRPGRSDAHYLRVGRLFTVLAACLSIATAYIVLFYNNLMDYLQLVISLFSAPLFALFLLGMFTSWATPSAGFCGLLCGVAAACAHSLAIRRGFLVYGSPLLGDFYGAFYAWLATLVVTAAVSVFTARKPREELAGVTYFTLPGGRTPIPGSAWVLAFFVLAACVALNILFR